MILTHQNLRATATAGCGFNKAQLQLLGVPIPSPKGWLYRLVGTEIDDEKYAQLLALNGMKQGKKNDRENLTFGPRIESPQSLFMAMQIPLPLVPLVTKLLETFKALRP